MQIRGSFWLFMKEKKTPMLMVFKNRALVGYFQTAVLKASSAILFFLIEMEGRHNTDCKGYTKEQT